MDSRHVVKVLRNPFRILRAERFFFSVKRRDGLFRFTTETKKTISPCSAGNPNLKPIGKGFGFLVFDLKQYISDSNSHDIITDGCVLFYQKAFEAKKTIPLFQIPQSLSADIPAWQAAGGVITGFE